MMEVVCVCLHVYLCVDAYPDFGPEKMSVAAGEVLAEALMQSPWQA